MLTSQLHTPPAVPTSRTTPVKDSYPSAPLPVVPVTVAYGDGIGPEIMTATLRILDAAGARLALETIEIGERIYEQGHTAGITNEAWESLRRTRVFLKAPITTPQGRGVKSLNVTIRKTLALYASVRPCITYAPYVATAHPGMDVVIIRENEEDLYAGIEHRQTDEVYQCLKIVSRPGCERIVRYAFEYARQNGRRKVTCFTKDNIMKLTDGLFHQVFDEIAAQYPDIVADHWIIDIGSARLATRPTEFDVIVTTNLYGDIISDIAAEISGSIGLAGSANIGVECAMFEAVHGSAPRIGGQNRANPSGLLLSAVMMLVHIGQPEVAERVHNAWLRALEEGLHTEDMVGPATRQVVGTREFAQAVIERLGQRPTMLTPTRYRLVEPAPALPVTRRPSTRKAMVGVDVFLHWRGDDPLALGAQLERANDANLKLVMVTNRGVMVWPSGLPETFCTDHYRCRFVATTHDGAINHSHILNILQRVNDVGLDFVKMEMLYTFDGQPGYTLGQGQ